MTTPLHSKVPVDLHPDTLSAYDEDLSDPNTEGPSVLDDAKTALAIIYEWHANVQDADDQFQKLGNERNKQSNRPREYGRYLLGSTQRVFHGQESEVYNAALEAEKKAFVTANNKLMAVHKYQERLDRDINKELESPELSKPVGIGISAQIRDYVRNITPPKNSPNADNVKTTGLSRMDFMRTAIKNGDKLAVASILGAPHYLSGLTAEEHAAWREEARRSWAPGQYKQLKALEKVSTKIADAAASMHARSELLSKTLIGAVAAKEKSARDALKKLMGERLAK